MCYVVFIIRNPHTLVHQESRPRRLDVHPGAFHGGCALLARSRDLPEAASAVILLRRTRIAPGGCQANTCPTQFLFLSLFLSSSLSLIASRFPTISKQCLCTFVHIHEPGTLERATWLLLIYVK